MTCGIAFITIFFVYFHPLCSHTALYPQGNRKKPRSKALPARFLSLLAEHVVRCLKPQTRAEEKQEEGHRSG